MSSLADFVASLWPYRDPCIFCIAVRRLRRVAFAVSSRAARLYRVIIGTFALPSPCYIGRVVTRTLPVSSLAALAVSSVVVLSSLAGFALSSLAAFAVSSHSRLCRVFTLCLRCHVALSLVRVVTRWLGRVVTPSRWLCLIITGCLVLSLAALVVSSLSDLAASSNPALAVTLAGFSGTTLCCHSLASPCGHSLSLLSSHALPSQRHHSLPSPCRHSLPCSHRHWHWFCRIVTRSFRLVVTGTGFADSSLAGIWYWLRRFVTRWHRCFVTRWLRCVVTCCLRFGRVVTGTDSLPSLSRH